MRRELKNKLTVLTVCLLSLLILAGCGGAPTLGQPKKDYTGFKTLKEADIQANDGKNKIQLFIPAGSGNYTSKDYATGSKDGVRATIRLVDTTSMKAFQNDLKKTANGLSMLKATNLEAAEQKTTSFKSSNDGKTYTRNQLLVLQSYDKTYQATCKTEFFAKVDDDNFVTGVIEVSPKEAGSGTDSVIQELEQFYGIKIYWDKAKAEERAKYYTEHPPTTKRVYVAGYTMAIPRSWARDASSSTSTVTVYGPSGTAKVNQNLLVAYKYISADPDTFSEAQYKALLQKQFPGMAVTIKKTSSPLSDAACYFTTLKKSGVTVSGYFLFSKTRLIAIYTQHDGAAISGSAKTTLDSAIKSLAKYDSDTSTSSSAA